VVWVACADFSLREGIERRLRSDLAPAKLPALTWQTHPAEPWDEILTTQEQLSNPHSPIMVHYDAIEPLPIELSCFNDARHAKTASNRALLRLNLGRDVGIRRGIVLLLWVRGIGPLEVVQQGGPDLWAHRLFVCLFPSTADFPTHEGWHFDDSSSASEQAQTAELASELEIIWLSDYQRFIHLSKLVYHLTNIGRIKEMLRRLDEMREVYEAADLEADPFCSGWMLDRELVALATLDDVDGLEEILQPEASSPRQDTPIHRWSVARFLGVLYGARGELGRRLDQLEHELANAVDMTRALHPDKLADSASLVHRASYFHELALPLRAVVDAHEAERRVAAAEDASPPHRHVVQSAVEAVLAEASGQMGLVDEALEWGWRALRRRSALGAWARVRQSIDTLASLYIEIGLPGIPRELWLAELAVVPTEDDVTELRRVLHQRLAELGIFIGDIDLARSHGSAALTDLSIISDLPPSLYCQRLYTRAVHARTLRPHWSEPTALDHWVDEIGVALTASETPPFHRDVLRLELARWHLATGVPDEASSLVAEAITYRTARLGPQKVIEAHILAAEIECSRGNLALARGHLDSAHHILSVEPEQTRPFSLWRDLQRQRAVLAHAEGRPEGAWAAFDVLLDIADGRHLVPRGIDLRLEQAETNLGHPKARENADACLARTLELGYMRLEGRARLLLAELAWQRRDRDAVTRELEAATWLVDQLGPIEAQQRARALNETLRAQE
jgi:hypothetical protein